MAADRPPPPDYLYEAFRKGLRDLGYVEGRNIVVVERWAEGKTERLPTLAAELVQLRVNVIVTSTTLAIQAAQKATGTIPIVMALSGDPVGTGLVGSLARPGGNITGLSNLGPELDGKRLELLKEALPRITRVAFLWNPDNRGLAIRLKELRGAARRLGITLLWLEARNANDVERVLAGPNKEKVGALHVPPPVATPYRKQIMDFAARNRLPVMYDTRDLVEAGGFMSYGPNFADQFRRAATSVDKNLKDAKPADLPVEQPTRFELAISRKSAMAHGLKLPQSVLVPADQVIQ